MDELIQAFLARRFVCGRCWAALSLNDVAEAPCLLPAVDEKRRDCVVQVTSPSGRAVFKFDFTGAGAQSYVDVLVCREPEPANLPLSDGTVTCYRNDTFIWWVSIHSTPSAETAASTTTSFHGARTIEHAASSLEEASVCCIPEAAAHSVC